MRRRVLLSPALLLAMLAHGQGHHHGHSAAEADGAHIIVTINPEARVSVVRQKTPAPQSCGERQSLLVKVVNQSFVSAPLQARIVGDGGRYVALHFESTRLHGGREETRTLHLVPRGPDPADVTIAFSISRETGDLGGRDRVHLFVRCS